MAEAQEIMQKEFSAQKAIFCLKSVGTFVERCELDFLIVAIEFYVLELVFERAEN